MRQGISRWQEEGTKDKMTAGLTFDLFYACSTFTFWYVILHEQQATISEEIFRA